jgi:hypothetical protein
MRRIVVLAALLFGCAESKPGLVPPYAPAGYRSDMPGFGGTLTRLYRVTLVERGAEGAQRDAARAS